MRFFDIFKRKPKRKIKLGIALGSGGAKGFAHVGALKAFAENGIEFDYIAGTSIGSIVGAFYSQGYTAIDILNLIETVNYMDFIKMVAVRTGTNRLENILDKLIGGLDISELKKPFMAVTTDVDTGEEIVFDKGNAGKVLSASSSFLPFFRPVNFNGRRLVDGAYNNSIPANLVKKMGADYIVGIDLSCCKKEMVSILDRFTPDSVDKNKNVKENGYKYSDIMLTPDLSDFKATSFTEGFKMYEIGYEEAVLKIPKIKQDLEVLKKSPKYR